VLRRRVWLLRRTSSELPLARRDLARSGRLRWLQKVKTADATWDAFEATPGVPFPSLIEGGKRVPWGALRHWLHDLASELWAATGDQSLPAELKADGYLGHGRVAHMLPSHVHAPLPVSASDADAALADSGKHGVGVGFAEIS